MDIAKTIEILEALASGCSPKTGEMVGDDSVLNEREVIRALQFAIDVLKRDKLIAPIIGGNKKGKPYKEVDFFQKEKFNMLTIEAINKLKKDVKELGVIKLDNLSEYIINARLEHPRAYEAWSDKERQLLSDALKYTNDLDLLSECFQRGKGSIESFGQKLIYESKKL
jgi:hypothetical protein